MWFTNVIGFLNFFAYMINLHFYEVMWFTNVIDLLMVLLQIVSDLREKGEMVDLREV